MLERCSGEKSRTVRITIFSMEQQVDAARHCSGAPAPKRPVPGKCGCAFSIQAGDFRWRLAIQIKLYALLNQGERALWERPFHSQGPAGESPNVPGVISFRERMLCRRP